MQNYTINISNSCTSFGMALPERTWTSDSVGYRFGFGGQMKDDEVYGKGNSYTAEYWQYDSRLGRRWNVDPVVKAMASPFLTFANNPIIFIDPNGDTEFYNSKGRWVGSDGKSNNLLAVTTNGRVRREIRRNSRKGRYSDFGELKNGDKRDGLFVVNRKVLETANEILDLAYKEDKENPNSKKEFGKVLKEKNNDFVSSELYTGENGSVSIPIGDGSGVSIHSHPVGAVFNSDDLGVSSSPLEPSPARPDGSGGDELGFKGYEMNIIVGNVGEVVNEIRTDPVRGTKEKIQERGNEPRIVFYNSKTKRQYQMSGDTADRMLGSNKGDKKRQEKFENKVKKNEK